MAYQTAYGPQDQTEQAEEAPPSSKTHQGSSPSAEKKDSKKGYPKPPLKNGMWWKSKELLKDPHELLDNIVQQIEDDQQGRYEAYREYERLFGASVGPNGDDSFRSVASDDLIQNELQNTIETLWAGIYKNKVVPACSVSDADWDEWDRAKSYSRWLEGAFDAAKVYEEAFPQAGICQFVHGTGIVRVGYKESSYGDKDCAEVTAWSVNPRMVLVDRMEAKHGKPRSVFFKDHIDRYVLWDTYSCDDEGFYKDATYRCDGIDKCTGNDDPDLMVQSTARCDMLTVREAFHLPSGPNSEDGRHVIWIRGCTLLDEPFTWDTFPCVRIQFGCPMEGWYGESAVKRLAPTQRLLDKLNIKIDQAQDVMGVPRILLGNGGEGVKTQHIDDYPGAILAVPGDVNQVRDWNAQCATPELYGDRDSAPGKMRSLLGVSDFSTDGSLPAKLREVSGPSLERMLDQTNSKHAMTHGAYENAVVALAELFARQAEELQEKGYDVVVKGPGTTDDSIEELSFKDICVDRRRMKLRVQPMSQFPQTFAGKVDAIEKMKQADVPLDPRTAMRMLEVPDPEGANDMLVSDEAIIMKNLTHMSKTGDYLPPMPFDNLDLIVKLTTQYINRYRVRKNADYDRIGLLAQYIDDAVQLKKGLGGANPSAPPTVQGSLGMGPVQGAPMGGPPMGPEGMPPGGPPTGMPPPGPMAAPPGPPGPPIPQPPAERSQGLPVPPG